MTQKEKFLGISRYEEFDKRRDEFRGLSIKDQEIRAHAAAIFPKVSDSKEELYKNPVGSGKKLWE